MTTNYLSSVLFFLVLFACGKPMVNNKGNTAVDKVKADVNNSSKADVREVKADVKNEGDAEVKNVNADVITNGTSNVDNVNVNLSSDAYWVIKLDQNLKAANLNCLPLSQCKIQTKNKGLDSWLPGDEFDIAGISADEGAVYFFYQSNLLSSIFGSSPTDHEFSLIHLDSKTQIKGSLIGSVKKLPDDIKN